MWSHNLLPVHPTTPLPEFSDLTVVPARGGELGDLWKGFLREVLVSSKSLTGPELTHGFTVAIGPREPSVSAFPVLRLQMGATKPGIFSNGFWGSNSSPHVRYQQSRYQQSCLHSPALSSFMACSPTPRIPAASLPTEDSICRGHSGT